MPWIQIWDKLQFYLLFQDIGGSKVHQAETPIGQLTNNLYWTGGAAILLFEMRKIQSHGQWHKCIGPACWGCHAKPTWFSSEFYLWGEEKSSGRQSNWASPVRPLPNRPIFNSRADSPPHTTSSNQKSTLFLEEEKKSVLSIINSPLYFCFEKISRHFAFFRRKLIQSGSLPGASCGYPTSRKEVNCDYFSMGRR